MDVQLSSKKGWIMKHNINKELSRYIAVF